MVPFGGMDVILEITMKGILKFGMDFDFRQNPIIYLMLLSKLSRLQYIGK